MGIHWSIWMIDPSIEPSEPIESKDSPQIHVKKYHSPITSSSLAASSVSFRHRVMRHISLESVEPYMAYHFCGWHEAAKPLAASMQAYTLCVFITGLFSCLVLELCFI